MTNLQFLDLCKEHDIKTEEDAWAVAATLEEQGDKGLLAHLLSNDVYSAVEKANKARTAKADALRAKQSRMEILREAASKSSCTCYENGLCYRLLKDVVVKNNIDGDLQRLVIEVLQAGRQKMRNLCIIGSRNMAKSFLLKPLTIIYKTYQRPDGGTYQLEKLPGSELIW